jgi:elongation factor P hydroxylase
MKLVIGRLQGQRRLLPDLGYWYAPDGRTLNSKAYLNKLKLNLKPLNGYLPQLLVEISCFFR